MSSKRTPGKPYEAGSYTEIFWSDGSNPMAGLSLFYVYFCQLLFAALKPSSSIRRVMDNSLHTNVIQVESATPTTIPFPKSTTDSCFSHLFFFRPQLLFLVVNIRDKYLVLQVNVNPQQNLKIDVTFASLCFIHIPIIRFVFQYPRCKAQ